MTTHCKNVIRIVCCFILVIFSHLSLHAKSSNNCWVRTYGGAKWDEGHCVQQTSDRGYIIVGETESFGAGHIDVYLVKVNSKGDTLWTRTYGGASDDYAWEVQQTSDRGYIIVGVTNSFGIIFDDIYCIKTDKNGDTLWTRTYGGEGIDRGRSVQQTSDGGYFIVGSTDSYRTHGSDIYLVETDKNGDTLWTKTYGETNVDKGLLVKGTADGGYIILGTAFSSSYPYVHIYLVKVDRDGTTLWTKTYNGEAFSIQQTNDGGFIIAGRITYWLQNERISNVYLVKTNGRGDTLWTRTYKNKIWALGNSVQQTFDGGYIIVGRITTYIDTIHAGKASRSGIYLVKTDTDGDTLWTRVYGGPWGFSPYSVQQTSDSGYVITGRVGIDGQYDLFLLKANKFGYCPPFDEFVKIKKKNDKPDTGISTTHIAEEIPYIKIDSDIYKKPKLFNTSEIARKAGVEGDVVVKALVDIDGSIMKVDISESSGYEILDDAAFDIAKEYKFSPGSSRRKRKRIWITKTIKFRFNE